MADGKALSNEMNRMVITEKEDLVVTKPLPISIKS